MSTKKTKQENNPTNDEVVRLKQLHENQYKTIVELKASGEEMGKEILTLKKRNAALRGLNGKLQKEVEKYKASDREGDELNEKRIAEIEDLNKTLCCKDATIELENKTIAGLELQVGELTETVKEQANRIEELKGDVAEAKANLDYYKSLPWYKKIFIK